MFQIISTCWGLHDNHSDLRASVQFSTFPTKLLSLLPFLLRDSPSPGPLLSTESFWESPAGRSTLASFVSRCLSTVVDDKDQAGCPLASPTWLPSSKQKVKLLFLRACVLTYLKVIKLLLLKYFQCWIIKTFASVSIWNMNSGSSNYVTKTLKQSIQVVINVITESSVC